MKRKKAYEQTGANSTFKRKCIVEQNYLTLKTERTMKRMKNIRLGTLVACMCVLWGCEKPNEKEI